MHQKLKKALGGILGILLLVLIYSFAPSRAIAHQLLSVFRVRKVAIIPLNVDTKELDQRLDTLTKELERIFPEPQVTVDAPIQKVDSLEEAKQLAGFPVRWPSYWPEPSPPHIQVEGRSEYTLPITGEDLATLLELAGMRPKIPRELHGTITVRIPAIVYLQGRRLTLWEVYNPSIEYPQELNPQILGEASLRLLGVPPSQARRIAKGIDWTSTFILPIPTQISRFDELEIAGAKAILLHARNPGEASPLTLLWVKDDVLYFLSGPTSSNGIIQIAESLF
ncbi:MAG: hypothetical protein J7M05_03400 [Anaerolineae bacterium]|nr:hypothetical protein [Anaerolineae bacterium]